MADDALGDALDAWGEEEEAAPEKPQVARVGCPSNTEDEVVSQCWVEGFFKSCLLWTV